MSGGLFVTGSDTGVGRTAVAAGIAACLHERGVDVYPLKPVETGWPDGEPWPRDAGCLTKAARREDLDRADVCPVAYREPLAPTVAARRAGEVVDLARIDQAYKRASEGTSTGWMHPYAAPGFVIVEGEGGLLVPVTDDTTMADLAAKWKLPILVVARPGPDMLNHTTLTVHEASRRGLDVVGIVISHWPDQPDTRASADDLERLTDVPVLGRLPELDDLDTSVPSLDGLLPAMEALVDLNPILELVDRSPQEA